MKLDRNGIPILDSPKEANKLTPHCKPNTHLWVTVKSETEIYGHDELVRECSRCGLLSAFTSANEEPWVPYLPTSCQAAKLHVRRALNEVSNDLAIRDYEESLELNGVRVHEGNFKKEETGVVVVVGELPLRERIVTALKNSELKPRVVFIQDEILVDVPKPDARHAIDILRDGFVAGEMSRKRCPLCGNRPCRCGAHR